MITTSNTYSSYHCFVGKAPLPAGISKLTTHGAQISPSENSTQLVDSGPTTGIAKAHVCLCSDRLLTREHIVLVLAQYSADKRSLFLPVGCVPYPVRMYARTLYALLSG